MTPATRWGATFLTAAAACGASVIVACREPSSPERDASAAVPPSVAPTNAPAAPSSSGVRPPLARTPLGVPMASAATIVLCDNNPNLWKLYAAPGCGAAAVAKCGPPPAPCAQHFCGCDGRLVIGCGATLLPYAHAGDCLPSEWATH